MVDIYLMSPLMRLLVENFGWDTAHWVYDLAMGGSATMSALFYSVIAAICAAVTVLRKSPTGRLEAAATAAIAWFLVVFWTTIGIGVLNKSDNFDYALVWQGITVRGQKDMQIGLQFVNYGPSAIKYEVNDFAVVIGNTTIPSPRYDNLGGVIPKGGSRNYSYPPFVESVLAPYLDKMTPGSLSFTVNYGPYGGLLKRTLKMKLNVSFLITDKGLGVADTIASEVETPYRGE
jgi:hypothetical protein